MSTLERAGLVKGEAFSSSRLSVKHYIIPPAINDNFGLMGEESTVAEWV
jgi:hypothetical protein